MRLPVISKLFQPTKLAPMLVIDLGTDTVKAALIQTNDEGEAKVLGESRQKQGLTSMRGQKIVDFDAVLETLNLAVESAELNSNFKAKKVILGVSGQIKSVGMTVRLKRPEPEKEISQKELSYLFQKIEEKTVNQSRPRETDELVGSEITAYRIDGQKLVTPLGLSGPILEVSLIHNFCSKSDLNTLQSLVSELGFQVHGIAETTIALAQTLINSHEAAVLIDVGGEITEVIIFKNGKIIGNKVFSLGGRNLSLTLCKELNLNFDQAEKLKRDLAQGFLDAERAREAREITSSYFELWTKSLEATLASFADVKPLPALFLAAGGGAALEEIKSALISHPWNRVLPFSAFPKIERLKADPLEALGKTTI